MQGESSNDAVFIDADDMQILNDVIAVCEDGRALFQHVAEQASDQQSKNVFSGMASVRGDIVEEFAENTSQPINDAAFNGTGTGTLRQWYADAKARFSDNKELAFIEQIEASEKRSLSILKKAVKNISNRILAQRLASLTASFQISLDRLALLKETYK